MPQHLVMFIVDDDDPETTKESLEKFYNQHIYDEWGNGTAIIPKPVVVELTLPEYSGEEQDYIGDQIAEMQEEIVANKD